MWIYIKKYLYKQKKYPLNVRKFEFLDTKNDLSLRQYKIQRIHLWREM